MTKPGSEEAVRGLLEAIGEDSSRPGLEKTPERYVRALQTLTAGYHSSLDEKIGDAIFNEGESQMVLVKNIEFYSLCEHHVLPFFGTAHVAYIPDGKIIGLSKIARIVDHFARRLQVQERLSAQIVDELMDRLSPLGAGCVLEAKHLCMMMRGVEKQESTMLTSAMRGVFLSDARTREEFLSLLRRP